MIIFISGKQGSGKSSLTQALRARIGMDAIIIRFATPLYEMMVACLQVCEKYSIPVDTKSKNGYLLQMLGKWGREYIGYDVWANSGAYQVNAIPKSMVCLIEDGRFENEFNIMNKFPDCISVRLDAPEQVRRPRTESWRATTNDISETNLDEYARLGRFQFYFNTETTPTSVIADRLMIEIDRIKQTRAKEWDELHG